ncbi:MAG: BspA family leucine-rich repeat surface protein [Bacteroidota bacterium]
MKLKNLLILVLALAALSCSKDDDKTTQPEQENNAPTIEPDQTFSVPETKTPGDNLGVVDANDDDKDDTLVFSITGEAGPFVINSSTGVLTLAEGQSLDHDTTSSYTLTISVTDNTDTVTETITINVTNVNQAPAIGQQGQPFQVQEDATSSDVIGTIDVQDPDGDDLTFEITVNSNNLFTVNGEGEIRLADGKNLDYETATSHEITVQVSDNLLTDQETFTIVVENVIDAPYRLEKSSFVITFETGGPNQQVGLVTDLDLEYDYIIEWEDGTIEERKTGDSPTHIYESEGIYTVAVNGIFPKFKIPIPFNLKLRSIEQWGAIEWESFEDAFRDCVNMVYNAPDAPNLSNVTNVSGMFSNADSFNADLTSWNVSNITDMSYMFNKANLFNGNISNWNVTSVKNMEGMFSYTPVFNSDISGWVVSSVDDMSSMFHNAKKFNGNISNWKVNNVNDMSEMFNGASAFEGDLSEWVIAEVTNMGAMFQYAYKFNSDISGWDTGKVTNMSFMFDDTIDFNQNLGEWDISSIENMTGMLDYSGVSPSNYNSTLIGWAAQEDAPHNITLGAFERIHCNAGTVARNTLIGIGWEFVGDFDCLD